MDPLWAFHGDSYNQEENWLLRFMRLWWFIHLLRKEGIHHITKAWPIKLCLYLWYHKALSLNNLATDLKMRLTHSGQTFWTRIFFKLVYLFATEDIFSGKETQQCNYFDSMLHSFLINSFGPVSSPELSHGPAWALLRNGESGQAYCH